MLPEAPLPLPVVFDDLPDPRRATRNKRHLLTIILILATCAVVARADTWDDIAEYGWSKETFFRGFLVHQGDQKPLVHVIILVDLGVENVSTVGELCKRAGPDLQHVHRAIRQNQEQVSKPIDQSKGELRRQ